MNTTHGSHAVVRKQIGEFQRMLRDLKQRVDACVKFPPAGGRAIEDERATELLDELHDFFVIFGSDWRLELTSPFGAFSDEGFVEHFNGAAARAAITAAANLTVSQLGSSNNSAASLPASAGSDGRAASAPPEPPSPHQLRHRRSARPSGGGEVERPSGELAGVEEAASSEHDGASSSIEVTDADRRRDQCLPLSSQPAVGRRARRERESEFPAGRDGET